MYWVDNMSVRLVWLSLQWPSGYVEPHSFSMEQLGQIHEQEVFVSQPFFRLSIMFVRFKLNQLFFFISLLQFTEWDCSWRYLWTQGADLFPLKCCYTHTFTVLVFECFPLFCLQQWRAPHSSPLTVCTRTIQVIKKKSLQNITFTYFSYQACHNIYVIELFYMSYFIDL